MHPHKLFKVLVLGGAGLTAGPMACMDPSVPPGPDASGADASPPDAADVAAPPDAAVLRDAAVPQDASAPGDAATSRDVARAPDAVRDASADAGACADLCEVREDITWCEGACCWLVPHVCCGAQ